MSFPLIGRWKSWLLGNGTCRIGFPQTLLRDLAVLGLVAADAYRWTLLGLEGRAGGVLGCERPGRSLAWVRHSVLDFLQFGSSRSHVAAEDAGWFLRLASTALAKVPSPCILSATLTHDLSNCSSQAYYAKRWTVPDTARSTSAEL